MNTPEIMGFSCGSAASSRPACISSNVHNLSGDTGFPAGVGCGVGAPDGGKYVPRVGRGLGGGTG